MTSSLVMLLTGPLQSWGGPTPGVYERPTEPMPTLSGIVGILANALGHRRGDDITDLASGTLTVRADRPGARVMDYHTIGSGDSKAPPMEGSERRTITTQRQYLADAAFLAAYTPSPNTSVDAERLLSALNCPARPLYLGRRSCPPATRIGVTVSDRSVAEIMRTAALLRDPTPSRFTDTNYYDAQEEVATGPTVQVLVESTAGSTDRNRSAERMDRPHTFDPRRLYHRLRPIVRDTVHVPASLCAGRGHDGLKRLYETLEVAR